MIVIGLMSGTSMDGIDAAAAELELDGDVCGSRRSGTRPRRTPAELAAALRAALPPNGTTMEAVCRLDTAVGQEFAAAAERARGGIRERRWWSPTARPSSTGSRTAGCAGTLQIGRPAWIAERTGLPVVSDLRSADVAAGGQGAPLVSLFDVLLLAGTPEPATLPVPRSTSAASPTSPWWARRPRRSPMTPGRPTHSSTPPSKPSPAARETYDRGGARAARGKVDEALLTLLLDDFFLAQPPPKTTGKERYHHRFTEDALDELGRDLAADDLLATLTAHAAEVAAAECRRHGVAEVIASGGGTENPVLMGALPTGSPPPACGPSTNSASPPPPRRPTPSPSSAS